MKNIWIWILLAGAALLFFVKSKAAATNAAAIKAGGQNIATNPWTDFWNPQQQASAKAFTDQGNAAYDSAKSIITGIFGATSGNRGAASPQTSGSGSGGPTQDEVDDAAVMFPTDYDPFAPAGTYGATVDG